MKSFACLLVTALLVGIVLGSWSQDYGETQAKLRISRQAAETVYIVNRDPADFPDSRIRKDIPSWEQAANKDFAPYWGTPQVRIRLVKKAPADGIVAIFQRKGIVQGALAYHTVTRGQPRIVVYSGTNTYYGYSVSISFTHELFETLGDPTTAQFNLPWKPYPYVTVGESTFVMPEGSVWLNEVSDPVEAYSYELHHVAISDFVTPNWFADQVRGPYDFMNVVEQPYTVAHGGYAIYVVNGHYWAVQNFLNAGRDAGGFFKGETENVHVKARP